MESNENRVAFVCHPYHRGGVTRWMADMAVAFQLSGYDTHFVTVKPIKRFISAPKSESMLQLLKDSNFKGATHSIEVDRVFELSSNTYKASVYQSIIKDKVPKGTPIILSDDYAVWLGACSVATDYKVIGVVHCSVSETYYRQTRTFFDQLAGIVTVSQRCTQKLALQAQKPLLTQPCGIPMSRPKYSIPMQRGHQLNPKTMIAWAGRMEDAQKRVFDFVPIAQALLGQGYDNFVFDIIGEGSSKAKLEADVKTNGLDTHFNFHGWQSKPYIIETLQKAQFYLLPSNYEGYPVAVMEAFACGCVVLSSRVSGIEDLEKEPDTAEVLKVFEVGDVQKATQYILELKDAEFITLSQKAKAIAYKYFSIDNCLKNYQSFLEVIPSNTVTKNAVIRFSKLKETLKARLRLWKYKILG